jgi:hypothetical protein
MKVETKEEFLIWAITLVGVTMHNPHPSDQDLEKAKDAMLEKYRTLPSDAELAPEYDPTDVYGFGAGMDYDETLGRRS